MATDERRSGSRRALGATEAKRLHREWRRRTDRRVTMLLDNVQTPFNVGSIVRTAASFRVAHLYIVGSPPTTPDHPKSKKTSLGTDRLVTWSDHPTIDEAVAAVRAAGERIIGVELALDASPLMTVAWGDGAVCIALGHEDRGLSPATLAACDAVAYVPTPGKVGSLNVAIAAGIAVYESRRADWSR